MDHLLSNCRHYSRHYGNCVDIGTSLLLATRMGVDRADSRCRVCVLALSPFCAQIIATALLAILLFSIVTQTALLVTNRRYVK